MENCTLVCECVLLVCVSVDGAHLSRTSVTCRVFNKVSVLGVSFAPRWHRISLRELSHTWPTELKCALRGAPCVRRIWLLSVCLFASVSRYWAVSTCAAQVFNGTQRERGNHENCHCSPHRQFICSLRSCHFFVM